MADALPVAISSEGPVSLIRRTAVVLAWTMLVAFAAATAGAVDHGAGAVVSAFFLAQVFSGRIAPTGPARWGLAAVLIGCALQLVPLPEAVRSVLAPGPTSARADLHALGLQGSWAPISVDVGATVYEGLLWAGALAALGVLGASGTARLGARVAVGLLVVLHVVGWLDFVFGVRAFPFTPIQDPWGVGQDVLRHGDFATGWLINRTHWAALGAILWPLAFLWARGGVRKSVAGLRIVVGSLVAAGVVASSVASHSRAGTVVVGLQVLALGVFGGLRLARSAGNATRIVLALACVAAVIAGLTRGYVADAFARVARDDVVARADLYRAIARMIPDSPVVGWGMGTFRSAFPAYQPDGLLYSYSHAHCDPLEWIAGGGVFGLALLAGLAVAFARGMRDVRASAEARLLWALSVVGGLAVACVEFPLEIPAIRFVWLGVLFVGPSRDRAATSPPVPRSSD